MRIIHVLRKPLSEGTVASNVLKHGVGGLNIDASRIGTEQVPINRLEVWSGFGQKERPAYVATTSKGRWPANVILQHLDGCRCDGVKRVRSNNPGNKTVVGGASTGECYGDYGKRSLVGHADKDGKETVANWICEPGCPVARLDEQSGERPSGGSATTKNRTDSLYEDGLSQRIITPYNDTGGASRFYKQVGGKSDG